MRYRLPETIGNPADWSFTWAVTDDVTLNSTCAFCGQASQRLTYEVRRENHSQWVCQRCTGRYAFSGMLDGARLAPPAARHYLFGLSARLMQQTCRELIRKTHVSSANTPLVEAALYFDRNLQLSPRHAACLFPAIGRLKQPVDIRIFAVQMRSAAHQREFASLDDRERAVVWPALSAQQKKRLAFLGFAPRRDQRSAHKQGRDNAAAGSFAS